MIGKTAMKMMTVKVCSNSVQFYALEIMFCVSIVVAMDEDMDDDYEEDDDLENLCPKYLIFSTGSKTYTPHQIGFKRIRDVNFPKKLEPGPSLRERIAAKEREKALQVIRTRLIAFCSS